MNMAFTACGASPGELNINYKRVFTEEHRKKLSESKIGKYVGENNPNFGKHMSDENKQKLSLLYKGVPISDERKYNISIGLLGENNPNFGRCMSDEQKKKISKSLMGKTKGEKNPNAKLNSTKVLQIRKYQNEKKIYIVGTFYYV